MLRRSLHTCSGGSNAFFLLCLHKTPTHTLKTVSCIINIMCTLPGARTRQSPAAKFTVERVPFVRVCVCARYFFGDWRNAGYSRGAFQFEKYARTKCTGKCGRQIRALTDRTRPLLLLLCVHSCRVYRIRISPREKGPQSVPVRHSVRKNMGTHTES